MEPEIKTCTNMPYNVTYPAILLKLYFFFAVLSITATAYTLHYIFPCDSFYFLFCFVYFKYYRLTPASSQKFNSISQNLSKKNRVFSKRSRNTVYFLKFDETDTL